MSDLQELTAERAAAECDRWLRELGAAFGEGSVARTIRLFEADGYWRDILSFTGAYATFSGAQEIASMLEQSMETVRPRDVRPADDRTAPRYVKRSGRWVIEAYFDFDTSDGRGTGFVRLVPSEGDDLPLAWMLLSTMQALEGFEERIGDRRPDGLEDSQDFARKNWLERRMESSGYADREPEVLIIGAGQSGLSLAARLGQMDADVLVVERTPRVGDGWRNRYHALTLHNEVWTNSLPYMPFPDTWPTFTSKDRLAGWLEYYAEAMEINVWTSTEFISGEYDEKQGRWNVTLSQGDGTVALLHPRHLVLATGSVSGAPKIPVLHEQERFEGEIIHTSEFSSGADYAGKKAVIFGTGSSGHDVAQDLYCNGATEVTIVQRSPTCVVSLVPSGTMVYSLYSEHAGTEDIDLITAAIPYPVLKESYQWITKTTCELDRELLEGLERVGFETEFGEDGTGFHMKYLRYGGGYYINVGCSDLIADGSIGLLKAGDIDGFEASGLRLVDGSVVEADLVVLATGYENQQEVVRRLLGDRVADKVGPVWGFDARYELRNIWKRTAQQGFWIMGGNLLECRLHSRFLALQIKADLVGKVIGATVELDELEPV